MWWVIWVGLGSMILLLLSPLGERAYRESKRGGGDMTEAINNARQIGWALYEFKSEYGKYPDTTTAEELRQTTGSMLSLPAKTSNDLFVQLMAAGIATTERMFYAKTKSTTKPDDVWSSDATILAHGECAFAYIMGVDPNGSPSTPLAFGPVIPGTKTFDLKANFGKVAVLRMDNSVTSVPITPAGKIIINGLDLLDPRQPFWNGKPPDVKWPK